MKRIFAMDEKMLEWKKEEEEASYKITWERLEKKLKEAREQKIDFKLCGLVVGGTFFSFQEIERFLGGTPPKKEVFPAYHRHKFDVC